MSNINLLQKELYEKIDVLRYFIEEIENNKFTITVTNIDEKEQIRKKQAARSIFLEKQNAIIKTEKYSYIFQLIESDPPPDIEKSIYVELRVYDKNGNSLDSPVENRIYGLRASAPYMG